MQASRGVLAGNKPKATSPNTSDGSSHSLLLLAILVRTDESWNPKPSEGSRLLATPTNTVLDKVDLLSDQSVSFWKVFGMGIAKQQPWTFERLINYSLLDSKIKQVNGMGRFPQVLSDPLLFLLLGYSAGQGRTGKPTGNDFTWSTVGSFSLTAAPSWVPILIRSHTKPAYPRPSSQDALHPKTGTTRPSGNR